MNVAPFAHFWKETSNIILARVSALRLEAILASVTQDRPKQLLTCLCWGE